MQRLVLAVVLALAGAIQPACGPRHRAAVSASLPCHARLAASGSPPIRWVLGPAGDRASLDSWCYGVGPALAVNAGEHEAAPPLDDLVIVTWNAHVGEGDVAELVAAIREGRLSGGRPARHFVLLVQEALRSSSNVPVLAADAASADAIGNGDAQGIAAAAAALDLSFLYIFRIPHGWRGSTRRGESRFGSDHYPVAATFFRTTAD